MRHTDAEQTQATGPNVKPAGFFLLRTPTLPFDVVTDLSKGIRLPSIQSGSQQASAEWKDDEVLVEARLEQHLDDPVIREAIYFASPGLARAFDQIRTDGDRKRRAKVLSAAWRYIVRMSARPTPFGMFAGVSRGKVGSSTNLTLPARSSYRRVTSIDGAALMEVFDRLHGSHLARHVSQWCANTSLYRVGSSYRYAEPNTQRDKRSYNLASVPSTPYLDAIVIGATYWMTWRQLTSLLEPFTDDHAAIEDFLNELVDSHILVSEHEPSASGASRIPDFTRVIRAVDEEEAAAWQRIVATVDTIDAKGLGVPLSEYADYEADVRQLAPRTATTERLIQSVVVKVSPELCLGTQVLAEIEKAIELLHAFADVGADAELQAFAGAFRERYGEQFIPLGEALDHDVGIGYSQQDVTSEAPTLLANVELRSPPSAAQMPWGARDNHMLWRLSSILQQGGTEWSLTDADVAALASPIRPPLPDTFSVLCALIGASAEAIDGGDFQLQCFSVLGPSGAEMIGRFCDASVELKDDVIAFLRSEERHRPNAVFAEIVHMPVGRLGNVAFRPILRQHEIAYLGRSELPPERALRLSDLFVGLDGERVVLWAPRLNREVVPRLSTAHAAGARVNLPLYRFLYSLQHQGTAVEMKWNWGALLTAPFLPRVTRGKLVLARARWLVRRDEWAGDADGVQVWEAARRLRESRRIPRMVLIAEGDNQLLTDLENPVSLRVFASIVSTRETTVLLEQLPAASELPVSGPEGHFTHEIVVPFVSTALRAGSAEPFGVRANAATRPKASGRTCVPGGSWRYLKIYTGTAYSDVLLSEVIIPAMTSPMADAAGLSWFWLRYGDPGHHLRLRFRCNEARLADAVETDLTDRLAPLVLERLVSGVAFATYDRELERYGGAEAMPLVESLFCVDSPAIAHVLRIWREARLPVDDRWKLAIRAVDDIWHAFGLSTVSRVDVARRLAASFGAPYGTLKEPTRNRLSLKERALRATVDLVLRHQTLDPSIDDRVTPLLLTRVRDSTPVARAMQTLDEEKKLSVSLTDILCSLSHMTVNRSLQVAQRQQEAVLYHLLWKHYAAVAHRESAAARGAS